MKTLPTLLLLAVLITAFAAWLLPQGVSQATGLTPADAPVTVTVSNVTANTRAGASVRVSPAATPTLEARPASERQLALQRALESGDVCETSRLLGDAKDGELYGAFLAVTDPGGDALETYGRDGPMLSAKASDAAARKPKGIAARTALALKTGGVGYFPVSAADSDPAKGRALLLELEKQEPGNAFFPLFRLVLESRLGYTNDQLKATAEAASSASFLDSHIFAVDRELDDASWRNAALRYARTDYMGLFSIPWYDVTRVLERLDKEAGFPGTGRIADLLGDEALHAAGEGAFDTSRYLAAHQLDPARFPSITSLRQRMGWGRANNWPSPFKYENGAQSCEPAAYEAYFLEAREER